MRVILCEDSALFRRGLALLLTGAGVDVVDEIGDAQYLHSHVQAAQPDAVIIDIRMPPTFTDEGLAAAAALRQAHPAIGLLVLSTYAETAYAVRLLEIGPKGVGYLLKDRVDDAATVRDAIERVVRGETVIDPEIVSRLVTRQHRQGPLDRLTERERDILTLMAEGLSNAAIARHLHIGEKTVEGNITTVLTKLGLEKDNDINRRVLAVLTWLRAGRTSHNHHPS